MSAIVILNRVTFHGSPDLVALRKYHEEIGIALSQNLGYVGGRIWSDLLEPSHFLTAHVYRDLRAAESGLQTIAQESLLQQYVTLDHDPPSTTRVRVIEATGALEGHMTDADFVSLSVRVAEPGRGNELRDDLRRVFSECEMIPGFTGYLIGVNDVLEEETIGLAGWDSQAAFLQSLPEGIIAKVRCYRRAFSPEASHAAVLMDRHTNAFVRG